jgi:hypothetical protein
MLFEERKEVLRAIRDRLFVSHSTLSSFLNRGGSLFPGTGEIESIEKRLEEIDSEILEMIQGDIHQHLSSFLRKFEEARGPSDKVVFVMMKFPSGNTREDQILNLIYDKIKDTCSRYFGMKAVRADEFAAAGNIWDNAQVHALGSRFGIAIIENKYTNEFNPNVAMEAGYMAALGKEVLLLVEKTFPYNRADMAGRLQSQFTWGGKNADLKTVEDAVIRFLENQRIPREPGSGR